MEKRDQMGWGWGRKNGEEAATIALGHHEPLWSNLQTTPADPRGWQPFSHCAPSTSLLSTKPSPPSSLGSPSTSLLSKLLMGVGLEVWCQVTGHLPSPEVSESDESLLEQKLLEIRTISPTASLPQGTE